MEEKMIRQILKDGWTMTVLGENVFHVEEKPIPARVPGSVYSTLLDHALMPDPFYRDNELNAFKLMDNDFVFAEQFTAEPGIRKAERILLRFEGIDTLSEIALNGTVLGRTDNMHRTYEFDVTRLIQDENTLSVRLFSPTKFVAAADERVKTMESGDATKGYPMLRKAHCMFGWDWGPRLPDAGLYRPVILLGIGEARLSDDIRIGQTHHVSGHGVQGDQVSAVDLHVQAVTDPADVPGVHCEAVLTTPEGKAIPFRQDGTLTVSNPELWWPNGYGEHPLYTVTIRLVRDKDGTVLDTAERRIGLRTVRLDTSPFPDEKPDPHLGPQAAENTAESRHFQFVVNGLPIFAMGSDYIPEDNILSRVTPRRTRALMTDAAAVHTNIIRIWGGGYYPDDFFYGICDELGILIWQDFMFACSSYDFTREFEDNIRKEFVDVIRRVRHHACLALWCGNNEEEEEVAWQRMKGELAPKQFFDYVKVFELLIPRVLEKEDPVTSYWPSSPSGGGNFENTHAENIGDIHYWGVWHGSEPFTAYRSHHYRFLSEFGFQSFPCIATVRSFTRPEDRNVFSEVMEMHQRNAAANGKILTYLSATYRYPKNFEQILYASQMLQLDAIRYGVEHFRRFRGTSMGTIIWQLNDIWPVASWASIDYYGRWKALHYGERRFFAPVSLTCEEHGRLDQKPFVNSQPKPVKYSAALHVANETAKEVKGVVRWKLFTPDSSVIREGESQVTAEPFSGAWLPELDFTGVADERDMHLWYELDVDGTILSAGSALFAAPKHYHFADPRLTLDVSGDTITVHADAYAKGVCIESDDGNLRLSDNYFDMEKGSVTVKILGEAPKGPYRVQSVFDIA